MFCYVVLLCMVLGTSMYQKVDVLCDRNQKKKKKDHSLCLHCTQTYSGAQRKKKKEEGGGGMYPPAVHEAPTTPLLFFSSSSFFFSKKRKRKEKKNEVCTAAPAVFEAPTTPFLLLLSFSSPPRFLLRSKIGFIRFGPIRTSTPVQTDF